MNPEGKTPDVKEGGIHQSTCSCWQDKAAAATSQKKGREIECPPPLPKGLIPSTLPQMEPSKERRTEKDPREQTQKPGAAKTNPVFQTGTNLVQPGTKTKGIPKATTLNKSKFH